MIVIIMVIMTIMVIMMMMASLTAMVTILVKRCATCGKLESIHRDETTNVYLHK